MILRDAYRHNGGPPLDPLPGVILGEPQLTDEPELRGVGIPGKILQVFFDPFGRWRPSRYKVMCGGRGGGKSESIARVFVALARTGKMRFLCARMYQNSVADSVHRTIADAIIDMGLSHEFDVLKTTIIHRRTGSDFIFKGIQRDIAGIKSLKGVKYAWIEEAETVPQYEWQVLDPTFREAGSEIIISYNPDDEHSATHQMFNVKRPDEPECIFAEVNWRDNPFFPEVLDKLRRKAKARADAGDSIDQAAYDWIWEGKTRRITDAVVFRNKVRIEDFEEHPNIRPFYGADWGFSDDPTVLVRCYVIAENLYITHAQYGYHVDLDDIGPKIFDQVPGSKKWHIKGDAAQPGYISYLSRRYSISAAEKWSGSVEDGVAYLKAFKAIIVHSRCVELAQEFRLYSWKTDPKQLDAKGNPIVLPILVDKYNHGIDALRYSQDGYIQSTGPIHISDGALAEI